MTMAKYFALAATLLAVASLANAEGKKTRQRLVARLTAARPTVYLTFAGVLKTRSSDREPELGMVLHNNTPWLIHYHLRPGSGLGDFLPVLYRVERGSGESRNEPEDGDVVLATTLRPGRSVKFAIPQGQLAKGCSIYVEFNYDWERNNGMDLFDSEPVHRVYFHHYNLPRDQQR